MFQSLKKLLISVVDFNIFHWLTLAIIIISSFHFFYRKTIKPLLLKVGVRSKYVLPLIDSMWQLSFLIIGLLMIFVCLEGSVLGNWVPRLDKELTKCKLHEETTVQGTKTVFVLLAAFALHDIVNIWITKGFKNLEFFQKQVFFAIFVLTCYSKCTMFGLSLYFMSNWATVVEFASKLSFFAAQFTNSYYLRIAAKVLCGLSVSLWIYTYLYIYPVFLTHNKSVNSAMMKAELNMLIVLDFLTWIYLTVTMIISVFTRVVVSYAVTSAERPQSLLYFLFGCDPWILWLTHSQRSTISNDDEMLMSNAQRHMRTLRATITCRNLIMRKVNRMRADKEERNLLSVEDREIDRSSRFSTSTTTSSASTSRPSSPLRPSASSTTSQDVRSRSRSRSRSPSSATPR